MVARKTNTQDTIQSPFGMVMPGRNWTAGTAEGYGYGYQGSKGCFEINSNHYNTYFRELDTRIAKWWTIDPRSRRSAWESPYISMGNNPILRNDFEGDEWQSTSDSKKASQLSGSYSKREKYYKRQSEKYQNKLIKAIEKDKDKKIAKYNELSDHFTAGMREMQDAQAELLSIGNSERCFRFNQLDQGSTSGSTTTDQDGTTVFNYVDDANLSHELKHGYLTLTGEQEGIPGTGLFRYVDLMDEIECYTRQFYFASSSMPYSDAGNIVKASDITRYYIKGIYSLDQSGGKVYLYKSFELQFHLIESDIIRYRISKSDYDRINENMGN